MGIIVVQGATPSTAPEVIDYLRSDQSTSNSAETLLKTFTIPAGSVSTQAILHASATFLTGAGTGAKKVCTLGVWIGPHAIFNNAANTNITSISGTGGGIGASGGNENSGAGLSINLKILSTDVTMSSVWYIHITGSDQGTYSSHYITLKSAIVMGK